MKPPFHLGESRHVPLFLFDAGQDCPGSFQLVDKLDPGTGIGLGGGAGFAVLEVVFTDRVVHDARTPALLRICRCPAG
jgi:hypothetical protein